METFNAFVFGTLFVHLPVKLTTMIIVHDIFICKPGNASKLAKKFKEAMTGNKEFVNILTDMTGQFNKVVVVSQYENLTGYDRNGKLRFSTSGFDTDAELINELEAMFSILGSL